MHVTIRVVGSVEGLRRRDTYLALREATIVTAKREDFRIIHMSIQRDHLHLIVEAEDRSALSRGVRDSRSPPRGRSTRRSPGAAETGAPAGSSPIVFTRAR